MCAPWQDVRSNEQFAHGQSRDAATTAKVVQQPEQEAAQQVPDVCIEARRGAVKADGVPEIASANSGEDACGFGFHPPC
jgi:hypothetical protein